MPRFGVSLIPGFDKPMSGFGEVLGNRVAEPVGLAEFKLSLGIAFLRPDSK